MLEQGGAGVDPRRIDSADDLAEMLEALRRRADKSLRSIEHWGKQNGYSLARSTVNDVLTKKRAPRKEFVFGFVRACGIVDQVSVNSWIAAWERVREGRTGLGEGRPVDSAPPFCEESGLLRVGNAYLSGYDWGGEFSKSKKLDIFVAYGQTWRNIVARQLISFAKCPENKMRVYLPDIGDPDTLRPLAWRFGIGVDRLKEKIRDARDFYEGISVPGGARVEIYFRCGEFLFSAYRFDECSVVTFYSHTRTRASAPPALVCGAGSVSDFLDEQFKVIHQESRRVFPAE